MHVRTCPLCEAMCGIEVFVEGDRVTKVRANENDVWSKGHICPKGTALHHLHEDPDRLRQPLIRNHDGSFREASWSEAFEEVEKRLAPLLENPEALAVYAGNPVAHNFSLSRYIGAMIQLTGITAIYSGGTVDQWPRNVASALMYGSAWTIPVPDVDRADFLLMLGANPFDSQGSLLAAPYLMKRLSALRERGGRFIVVDPRRTGTAERADEWIPIQPGTDAALLLAMLHVLFADDLVNLGRLADKVDGLDALRELCADFAPEAVEETCRIPAARIRELAQELAKSERAVVYGRIGTCTQEFGTLASWLIDVLNILTGNFDETGGSMFSNPIAWSMLSLRPPEFEHGFELGRFRSRVRGAPEVLGQFPVSCLAEEIAEPGEGQIKALITMAGNPVLSAPGGDRLDEALAKLDCMISVDNWLNETTRHAHVILPGQSPFEQPHYDEMIWSWALRNAGKYSPALFPIPEGTVPEWAVLLQLAAMVQGQTAADVDVEEIDSFYFVGLVSMITEQEGSPVHGRDVEEILAEHPTPGPERIAPRLDEILATPSGKIELAPDYIVADLPRLKERIAKANEPLVLVSRRQLRSNNSWMHNVAPLMTGKPRCTLLIHPDDAKAAGVEDGGAALVRSVAGEIEVPVEVTDEMMPGVVCLPHGFGHDKEGARLSVASQHAGVCSNILAPGSLVDVPSGNAVVNGIPVHIAPG
jgi:anaerobic selenocysteine-containing dehydrogenase